MTSRNVCCVVALCSLPLLAGADAADKPEPPVDIQWTVTVLRRPAAGAAAADQSFQARARSRPVPRAGLAPAFLNTIDNVRLELRPSGALTLTSPAPEPAFFAMRRGALQPPTPAAGTVEFAIPQDQRGEIVAEARTTVDGRDTVVRRRTLFVLTTRTQLYSGTSSMLNLDLQRLKDDLSAGRITRAEYDAAVQKLLTTSGR